MAVTKTKVPGTITVPEGRRTRYINGQVEVTTYPAFQVRAEVLIDWDAIRFMAIKAAHTKGKRSVDGPLTVKVKVVK